MLGVNALSGFGSGPVGSQSFRYFRIDITLNNGGPNVRIANTKLFAEAVETPSAAMTSNTAPSPLVASASADDGAGSLPFNAFDDDLSLYWGTPSVTTGYLQLDVGSGNEFALTSVKITAPNAGIMTPLPKDFTIEGSNTGSFSGEETLLKTVTGETGWSTSEERTYTI